MTEHRKPLTRHELYSPWRTLDQKGRSLETRTQRVQLREVSFCFVQFPAPCTSFP